ncbi:PITH domain-containing protein [Scleroderma yunnanense]
MTTDEVSLLEHLDVSQVNCLNEQHDHDLKSIVASRRINPPESSIYLASDADEQLLINIHFNQAVRVRKLIIRCKTPSNGPKTIKLCVNKAAISFSDVEDSMFVQVLELSTDDLKGKPIPLRFVRFQSVNSLHIFVESNQGGEDETRIDAIDALGIPVEATKDLSGLGED